jgi:lipopolysaccharide biosynthesis protein
MTQHQDWHPIAVKAVKLGFDDNKISIDQDRVHKAIDLFSSIINNSEIDVAWPYLKYANLISDVSLKIELMEKAYKIEKNIFSCLNLIQLYIHVNSLTNAVEWLQKLQILDSNNQHVQYYFNKLIPVDFDPYVYQSLNNDLFFMNTDELRHHYVYTGIPENRAYKSAIIKSDSLYVPRDENLFPIKTKVKVIAHYFPQFHIIPENEEWWGKSFTDWTNVKKATPLFPNHYQPHIPDSYLDYYDLTDINIQKKQIELAKQYGIYGFCFYAYWFNGKRLLEKPLDNYLNHKELDLPFCICWANENWTKKWDGLDHEVLMKQNYSPEDDINFIKEMSKYLKDPRYIRVDNKPLLMIYRPSIFPNPKETAQRFRNWCKSNGIGEIYLVYPQSFSKLDPKEYGFDAASEFPPNSGNIDDRKQDLAIDQKQEDFDNVILAKSDWNTWYENSENYIKPDYKLFRSLMPSWDNSPRRKTRGWAFINTDPAKFQHIAENAFAYTLDNHIGDERIVFVNAWNEWGEGAHLEPDKKYGYAWLQAIKNAHFLTNGPSPDTVDKIKKECILSINNQKEQTFKNNEIAIVYHCFYPEYLDETIDYAEKSSSLLDGSWFIITTPANKLRRCKEIISQKTNKFNYLFFEVENKGKDVLPLFKIYSTLINLNIKAFCKIHSKKSTYSDTNGDLWRQELIGKLLNTNFVETTLNILCKKNNGIVIPAKYAWSLCDLTCNSEPNLNRSKRMAKFLDVKINENSVFPAGSMFWSRIESLIPMYMILQSDNETYFPEELSQRDNTFAHVCERLFCLSAESIGLKIITLFVY